MALEDITELELDNDFIDRVPCIIDSPLGFKPNLIQYENDSFSILNLNIRSIRKNFASFLSFLSMLMFQFSVLILCETWLSKSVDFGFDIQGYKQVNIYRNVFGGGIKIYYNEIFEVQTFDVLTFIRDYIEIVSVILHCGNFRYLLCAIYRPPSASHDLFNNTFFNEIIPKIPSNCSPIFVGDFNLNLFNPYNKSSIEEFMNNMFSLNFFPVITRPTRLNENINSIIPFSLVDHIWCNFKHGFCHISAVIKTAITDHFPVLYMFKLKLSNTVKTIKFRLIKQNNMNDFIGELNAEAFEELYEIENPDDAFSYFYKRLFHIYNSTCPVKKKRVKLNKINNPWVTPKLKKCIRKKYTLYNLLRRGLIPKSYFIKYKKVLNWVCDRMRRHYYIKKFKNINSI